MKNKLLILCCAGFLYACNSNRSTETTNTTDTTGTNSLNNSSNNTTNDSSINSSNASSSLTTDEASSAFLTNAADGGMAEVELGRLGQHKAKNQNVKNFSDMIVHDHSAANDQVRSLASQRNVKLPDSVSSSNKNKKEELMKKEGATFDKAYLEAMVKDHQQAISMFEKAAKNSKDNDVKNFITNTLPTLRQHLDSARSIRKKL